jgi:hypothetical protein
MKKLLPLIAIASCLAFGAAHATDEKKEPTAQQNKMKECNADPKAKELKGDERKAFMSDCLSAKGISKQTQQEKMKSCNAAPEAKTLKGDERKAFMSKCLSNA